MFSFFKSPPYDDLQLGLLQRSRGAWRGALRLGDALTVPLVICGPRAAPRPEALAVARSIPANFASWRTEIEQALFEHCQPYLEAIEDGEEAPPSAGLPAIEQPSDTLAHATIEYVQVAPLSGQLIVEIGYRVAWDEEHTLGVRLQNGKLLELCGSVLAP